MYKILQNLPGLPAQIVQKLSDESSFPMVISNAEYEQFLDDINEQGTSIVDGEIPESVLAEAANKKSKQQLNEYNEAVNRLSQYILSEGRPEIKQMMPTGERVFNQTTNEMDDVLVEVTTQYPVDPVPLTVQAGELNKDTMEMTYITVDNPVVVRDLAERAAAQAIVTAYENTIE